MSDYFRNVPDFDYVSRLPSAKISDYITVKNFFKRGFLREDIFQELSFFTKYQIKGDDRPDNVAWNFYQESQLDWLVLTCNNIVNIQTEWPLKQTDFDRFLLDKYDTYEKLNEIVNEFTSMFKDAEMIEGDYKHPSDITGKSTFKNVDFLLDSGERVDVSCYDFDRSMQTDDENPDGINIFIDSVEFMEWFG